MNKTYINLRKNKAWKTFEGKIFKVSGDDAEEILDLYIPKNMEFLDIDTVGYSFLLDEEGDVFDEITYYKLEDKYLLFSNKDLVKFFEYESGDFNIEDISKEKTMIQIEGKNSGDIAQIFYDYDILTLNFKSVFSSTFADSEIIIARFGFSGEFGYQILLDSSKTIQFVKEYLDSVEKFDDQLDEYVKFEVSHPLPILFESDKNLYELGYSWNLDFSKINFRGKESLLSKINNSNMQNIAFTSNKEVFTGDSVYFDKKKIGNILYIKKNLEDNSEKQYIGMIMVDCHYAHSGIHFLAENNTVLTTISSPYTIPESW